MNKEEAKIRIIELRRLLEKYNEEYYLFDEPSLLDSEYDALVLELNSLEEENPEFQASDSPTVKVGGKVSSRLAPYKHRSKLLSLSNAFNSEDLILFNNRLEKDLGTSDIIYTGELKIDGLSIALIYENGILVKGVTRGDGEFGEDVTPNVLMIEDIPKTLGMKIDLEVRGEIYMDFKTFELVNLEREEKEEKLFRNPRNSAAGTLRTLDPEVVKKRNLKSFIYEIMYLDKKVLDSENIKTQEDSLKFLEYLGFSVNTGTIVGNIEKIIEGSLQVIENRYNLGYGIDGFVVKVNELQSKDILGVRAKSPRYAIALKFPPEQKETVINSIELSMGRTGVLTPVANLEPVLIGGSIVSRATLHNKDFIAQKDIREKDYIILQKAGDIIPEVVSVLKEKRNINSEPYNFPLNCPSCNSVLEIIKEESFVRCLNTLTCKGQISRRLKHFVSKDAMDIDGLGGRTIDLLLKKEIISKGSDIYKLKKEDLEKLEGFKEKSINNLLESIERSKERPLKNFIFSLGIPLLGLQGSGILEAEFGSMDKIMNLEYEDLRDIESFGDKICRSIIDFFHEEKNRESILEFRNLGLKMEYKSVKLSNKLENLTFVLSGKLPNFGRDEFKELIENHGGKVSGSVSKKTSYLVLGDSPGSKYEKALKLQVKIIEEEELLKIIQSK